MVQRASDLALLQERTGIFLFQTQNGAGARRSELPCKTADTRQDANLSNRNGCMPEKERKKEMSLYTKVNTDLNFVEREHEVEQFWEDNKIFEKSMKIREGCPTLYLL